MPYRSTAQQRKFHAMAARGEISKEVVSEWDQATKKQPGGFKALPKKVKSAELTPLAKIAARALQKMAMPSSNPVPQLPSLVSSLSGGSGGAQTVAQAAGKTPSLSPAPTPPAAPQATPGAAPQPPVGWDMSKSHWMRPVGS
jgi:hypothetical protein